jgi:hypothetical protein
MPGEVSYEDAVDRSLNAKLGERFSVLDISPTAGKGVVNETPVFAEAYDAKVKKGGGSIYVPGAVGPGYKLAAPLEIVSTVPIEFIGEGYSSKLIRGADMPAGKGMLNLTGAKHVTFRHMAFDGDVLTSQGLLYSEFASDPAHPLLTKNSMLWMQGCEDITFEDCDFEHTGGYAAYVDARLASNKRIKFLRCRFRNNRPHTFGTAAADMMDAMRRVRGVKIDWERHFPELLGGSASIYGSWTGGIFYHNQATSGSTTRVEDLTVHGCQFQRNTGNCVWGHGYGFSAFHQRIHVDYNSFLDCGLDGILFGNVVGGSAIGNSMRRIGYICSDDSSPSVPRWLPNLNATGIDTSGVVKLVTYANNSFLNVNGGAINGDGFAYGTITGNTIRVSRPGDVEYGEDLIGSNFGPGGAGANWSQGVVTGNTSDKEGGLGITISGNFCDNLGGTGIGLFAARNCQASGNTIIVPNAANQQAITIGGILTGANQVATGNLVTENRIQYAPATIAPAIFEDPTYRVFTSADVNNVVKNYVTGANAFEFQRDPNSISSAAVFFTSSSVATWQSRHGIQREGTGPGSALRFYAQDVDPFGWLHMQLQMYWALGQRGPLLNVAEWGPDVDGEGGVITTGNVTSMPFSNAMATSKLSASGFLAMGDATYWEVDANKLPSVDEPGVSDGWALLRWDGLLSKWQQSVSGGGSAGPRIWTDFSGSAGTGIPAPPDQSVQFNNAGQFGGDAYFSYAPVTHQLTLYSYAYNGITMPNGGFLGENANVRKYVSFMSTGSISPGGADDFTGKAMMFLDSVGGHLHVVGGTGASSYVDWSIQVSGVYATGVNYNSVQVPNGGFFGHAITLTSHVLIAPQSTPVFLSGSNYLNNVLLFYDSGVDRLHLVKGTGSSTYADHGLHLSALYASSTAANAIQAPAGGVTALTGNFSHNDRYTVNVPNGGISGKWLLAQDFLLFTQKPSAAVSVGGEVRLYADTDGLMYISTNGQPYGPFGLGTPAGNDGEVQFNNLGAFGASANFYWHNTQNRLYITCASTGPGINVDGGWIQSAGGYQTVSAGLAVQALSGVIIGRYLATNESLLFKGLATPPGLSDVSGGPQVRLYASSGGVMYISSNGAAWGPLNSGTPPGGASGNVQYNKNGAFFGDGNLNWDFNSGVFTLAGYLQTNAFNNSVQWVMNRTFAPNATVYYVGIDESARYFVQAASIGPVLLYLTPNATATSSMLSTPGTVQSYYVNATGSSSATIQAASGGVTARWLAANESLIFLGIGQPALSTSGQVRMYASTSGVLYVSSNGQPYGPIGGQPPAGTNSQIQFNANGQFGATGNFVWDNTNLVMGMTGYIQTNRGSQAAGLDEHWMMHRPNVNIYYIGINQGGGWILKNMDGFTQLTVTPNGASNMTISTPGIFQSTLVNALGTSGTTIQAASGGIYGRWIIAQESLILKQGGQPAYSSPGEVRIYANSNGVTYISTAGQAYGPLGGITSTTQPQWTATNSGASYTFNNANNYFIVDGNGNISGNGVVSGAGGVTSSSQSSNAIQTAGGFNAGYSGGANGSYSIYGSVVINYSRQFVGSGGINTSGHIITSGNVEAASFNVGGGYYGQTYTVYFPGGFTVAGGSTKNYLYFKGGILWYYT